MKVAEWGLRLIVLVLVIVGLPTLVFAILLAGVADAIRRTYDP